MFHLDYETFSEADLPNVGSFRYAYDPSTEILCVAIAKGDGAPRIWVAPQHRYPGCPHDPASEALLMEMLVSDEPVYAHNVLFELPITEAVGPFHTPIDRKRWRCTAAMARRAGLPHSLGKLAEKLGLEQQKDRSGAALIRKFSLLQKDGSRILPKDDPEAFKKFCDYCVQDVRTEQAVHKKLAAFELKGFPLEVFQTDLEINCRGLPVNLDAIGKAKTIVEDAAATTRDAFKQLTGLEPTQGVAFLDWLKERGYEHEDLRADTIEEFLDSDDCDLDGEVGQALSLRRLVSFAATKKLDSFQAYAGPHDARVRGILMYYGAIRTGRWSSSGPQIQNAKKPPKHLEAHTDAIYRDICRGASVEEINFNYGNPIECVASCIRHFVQDDRPMLNADYSAIEARVLAWLAGEKWRLKLFTEGGDIYVASIAQMLGIPVSQVDKSLRQRGKVAELASGFQGGVGAYIKMGALRMGIKEDEIPDLVSKWRAANPQIKALWSKCEFAAMNAVSRPGQRYGVNGKLEFFCARTAGLNYLFLKFPSGRHIAYPEPKIETVQTSWGEGKESITFYGQVPMKKTWARISVYGGKFVENCLAGDTEVLTEHGWKTLQNVRFTDRVWDGDSWVKHGGLVARGKQACIQMAGIVCTPDHRFLTSLGWQEAKTVCSERFNEVSSLNEALQTLSAREAPRACNRKPNCEREGRNRREEYALESRLRVREGNHPSEFGANESEEKRGFLCLLNEVRVREAEFEVKKADTRKIETSCVRDLEINESEVHKSESCRLAQLWRKRHFCMRKVASILRELLAGCSSSMGSWLGFGQDRQQRALHAYKCSVGHAPNQRNESEEFSDKEGHTCRCLCAVESSRNIEQHVSVSSLTRLDLGTDHLDQTGPEEQETEVYDLMDCGPNHCFAVRNKLGQVFLAHNCCQGIAADVMAQGAVNCEKAGYEINALIHDEALAYHKPGQTAEEFSRLLTTVPDWAKGLPLAAPGGMVNYYRKD